VVPGESKEETWLDSRSSDKRPQHEGERECRGKQTYSGTSRYRGLARNAKVKNQLLAH